MGKFKEFYLQEGRNKWDMFELKQTDSRWSFKNTATGQRYFLKLGERNNVSRIQRFLYDIKATNESGGKTSGDIDFNSFAQKLVQGSSNKFYVKNGHWEDIKKTWEMA